MAGERKRIKHKTTLEERLAAQAAELREQAGKLPPGIERERLLKRARQNETAAIVTAWVSSPCLQPRE